MPMFPFLLLVRLGILMFIGCRAFFLYELPIYIHFQLFIIAHFYFLIDLERFFKYSQL